VAGELAARDGQLDEAQRLLARAVELQPAHFSEVIDIYLQELKRPDLARALAGDDYVRLDQLARACAANPDYAELAKEIRSAAIASLRRRASAADVAAWELVALAQVEAEQKRLDQAIQLYRQAVNRDYGQVEWRLELAKALAASNQYQEASREVQVCLRLRPQYGPAQQLQEELVDKLEGIEDRASR
jgi:predicted Zn-dependent protease